MGQRAVCGSPIAKFASPGGTSLVLLFPRKRMVLYLALPRYVLLGALITCISRNSYSIICPRMLGM